MTFGEFVESYNKTHDPIRTAMLGAAYRAEFIRQTYEYQQFIEAFKRECPDMYETFQLIDRRIEQRNPTLYGRLVDFKHDLVRALTKLVKSDRNSVYEPNR